MTSAAKDEDQTLVHDTFVDLLECCAHQILFHRCVYPERIFSRARHFGAPVRRADHPAVGKFVASELRILRRALEAGAEVTRVDMVIVDASSSREVETHAFRTIQPKVDDDGKRSSDRGVTLGELESKCRSQLLMLNARLPSLPALKLLDDEDPTFVFRYHPDMEAANKLRSEQGWAEIEPAEEEGKTAVPVHRIKGPLMLETFVML